MYDDLPAAGVTGGATLAMTGLADVPMLLAAAAALIIGGATIMLRQHAVED